MVTADLSSISLDKPTEVELFYFGFFKIARRQQVILCKYRSHTLRSSSIADNIRIPKWDFLDMLASYGHLFFARDATWEFRLF